MERERSKTRRIAWPQGLALAVVLMATSAFGAAGTSTSFRVGLQITASCRVDSAAVFQATTPKAVRGPDVRCDFGTPRAVQVTRESLPTLDPAGAVPAGSTVVVTLTF
jgi:hypothetical protein